MIRAVLDANVVVSALILKGPTNELVSLWREKRFIFAVSKEILQEYLRVLSYPRFQLSGQEIRRIVERHLLPFLHPVRVKKIPDVIHDDPSDNMFLGCAQYGSCPFVVSGDHDLLALKEFQGIKIVTVSAFLSFFELRPSV